MQLKCKSRLKLIAQNAQTIDRKNRTMLSFVCRTECNIKEVYALNASILIDKIVEKGLNVHEALIICGKIADQENLTIGDVVEIKKMLGLSNLEAIEIFLS